MKLIPSISLFSIFWTIEKVQACQESLLYLLVGLDESRSFTSTCVDAYYNNDPNKPEYACLIQGALTGTTGDDNFDCREQFGINDILSLHVDGGTIDFGSGDDTLWIANNGPACLFENGAQVLAGEGNDEIRCAIYTGREGVGLYSDGSTIDLGPGNDYLLGGIMYAGTESGCHLLNGAKILAGEGDDTIECETTSRDSSSIGLDFSGGSILDLGEGNDEVIATSDNGLACSLQGGSKILGDSGENTVMCNGGLNLKDESSEITFGDDSNTIMASRDDGGLACDITGEISFGRGDDSLMCVGGLHIRSGGKIEMGKGIDTVTVEGDITIDDGGQFFLGSRPDIVTATGCFSGGTIGMGNGDDVLIATALSGKVVGGNGVDCVQPVAGLYTLKCVGGNLSLEGGKCDGQDVVVELDEVEQIGDCLNFDTGNPNIPDPYCEYGDATWPLVIL